MNIEAAKAVLDEMDGVSGDMYDGSLTMHEDNFHDYARRIRDALEEDPQRGAGTRTPNQAALREAFAALVAYWDWNGFDAMRESRLKDMSRAALASPPRNCDIGSPEEQVDRHAIYCQYLKDTAARYNFNLDICIKYDCRYCFAKWAQMPYEEGGAKC